MNKKIKQKTCAYKGCKKKFTPFNSFQKTCHNASCAHGFVQQEKQKKEEAKKKQIRKDLQEFRRENKPISKWISEAQSSINAYVRARDFFDPCISCGKPRTQVEKEQGWKTGGCWDAGHYKSTGAHPELRFNLWNNNKECKSCNGGAVKKAKLGAGTSHEKTKTQEYENNLRKKIGDEKVDWLNKDHPPAKFTREYCERVKKIFKKRTKIQKLRNEKKLMYMDSSGF